MKDILSPTCEGISSLLHDTQQLITSVIHKEVMLDNLAQNHEMPQVALELKISLFEEIQKDVKNQFKSLCITEVDHHYVTGNNCCLWYVSTVR